MSLRLHYFDLPGRAEAVRAILTAGEVPFEDKRYGFNDPAFAELKARAPYGQLPVLEFLDTGDLLAQSSAIERYAAKLGKLQPVGTDLEIAKAESVAALLVDAYEALGPTMRMSDPEEKKKARETLLAGPLKGKFQLLEKALNNAENGFVCGGKLSYIDLQIWTTLCLFSSGWLDGFAKNCLDEYPGLQKFRYRIASLPALKEHYSKYTEGLYLAYQSEAVAAFAN